MEILALEVLRSLGGAADRGCEPDLGVGLVSTVVSCSLSDSSMSSTRLRLFKGRAVTLLTCPVFMKVLGMTST